MSHLPNLLPNQQQAFKRAILEAPLDAGSPFISTADSAVDLFQPRKNGAAPLLHIYQHAYTGRLMAALRDNYPVLQRVLGDAEFDALALDYIAQHPSTHPSIRWFGHQLEEFLLQHPAYLPHPAIVDLIRMEWAIRSAFDAADAPVLQVEDLLSLPAEAWLELRCQTHPTVNLLALQWEVAPIWKTLSDIAENTSLAAAADAVQTNAPQPHQHTLLIWRQQLSTRWRSLEPLESQLLDALMQNQPFHALCEQAAELMEESAAPATVAGLLRRWVEDGLLTQISIHAAPAEDPV